MEDQVLETEIITTTTMETIRREAQAEAKAELEAFISTFPPDIAARIRHDVATGRIPPTRKMDKAATPARTGERGSRNLELPDVKLSSDKERAAKKWIEGIASEVQGEPAPATEQINLGL